MPNDTSYPDRPNPLTEDLTAAFPLVERKPDFLNDDDFNEPLPPRTCSLEDGTCESCQ